MHSSACDGRCLRKVFEWEAVSGGRLSGRGARLLIERGDRSLPVSLDMWDGGKAVGDIVIDFKAYKISGSMYTSAN